MGRYDDCPTNTIFRLRREGKLLEALKMSREEFPDFSVLSDKWEIAAVGWTLVDLIEEALREGANPMKYAEMLRRLDFSGDDVLSKRAEPLAEHAEIRYAEKLESCGDLVKADYWAGRAAEAGDEDEANRLLCRTALQRVKTALGTEPADFAAAVRSMKRLLKLAEFGLGQKVRQEAAGFARTLAAVPEASFRLTDWLIALLKIDGVPPDRFISGSALQGALSQMAAEILKPVSEGKSVRKSDAEFAKVWFLDAVGRSRSTRQGGRRLDVDAARIAFLIGEADRARSWAAELAGVGCCAAAARLLAGDIEAKAGNAEAASRSYAAAFLSGTKAEQTEAAVKLVRSLIKAKARDDAIAAATWFIESRRAAGQPVPKALADLLNERGLGTAKIRRSGEAVVAELAEAAGLRRANTESFDGVVGTPFELADPKRVKPVVLLPVLLKTKTGGRTVVSAAPECTGGREFRTGEAVKVECIVKDGAVVRIVKLTPRPSGTDRDLCASRRAVVVRTDAERDVMTVRFSPDNEKTVLLSSVKASVPDIEAGDVVLLNSAPWAAGDGSVWIAIDAAESADRPEKLVRDFEGTIRIFGTADCAFGEIDTAEGVHIAVRPQLMTELCRTVRTGAKVKGRAVAASNVWCVARIEPV